jgi:uncharacterized membrane protein YuzA (DUF378 family)
MKKWMWGSLGALLWCIFAAGINPDLSRTGRLVYYLIGVSAVLFIAMALSDHLSSKPKEDGNDKKNT